MKGGSTEGNEGNKGVQPRILRFGVPRLRGRRLSRAIRSSGDRLKPELQADGPTDLCLFHYLLFRFSVSFVTFCRIQQRLCFLAQQFEGEPAVPTGVVKGSSAEARRERF